MKLNRLLSVGIAIGLLGIGCSALRVSTNGSFIYFDNSVAHPASSKRPELVKMHYKSEPAGPLTELGMVEAIASGYSVTLQDLMPELQRQAALMNADAVYKIELQRYDHAGEAMHAVGVAIKQGAK